MRLFAAALALLLVALAGATLWHLRTEALSNQKRQMSMLTLAVSDEIDRRLLDVHDGLVELRPELRRPGAVLHATDLGSGVPALWWVAGDGHLVSTTSPEPAPAPQLFAPALDGLRGNAAALSRPFTDPASGESRVALAVPFNPRDTAQGGWLIAALPARALLGAFSAATPAADARLSVHRDDGVTLAASSSADEPAGTLVLERRELPHFGVQVQLTRSRDAVLANWGVMARTTGVGALLLLAVLALALALVQRADRRRAEAQKALQAQMARSSKLEALGALAGGVAHDFNNVLAALLGHGEIARDAAAPGSLAARHLDSLLQAALRGKGLVERILAFGRGGARRSSVFELQPVVEEVLKLLAASLQPGIVIEQRLAAPGARVRGDPTQVFQAVMNLCLNGLQAMPAGGSLVVELARRRNTAAQVLSHARLEPGEWLALAVSDQGAGITPEVMERLFEPFFSTRSGGTGLGLAVVHGVVAEFGGAIDAASPGGGGARFTLYLPECGDALTPEAAPRERLPGGQGQTVMVVDDDPRLVALTEEMLAGLGYEPLGFADAQEALAALRAEPQRFDAVLSDEIMPGLAGTELAQAAREFAPGLPVLLQSGYGGARLAQRASAAGVARVLVKPLERAELARALAELLPPR
ncbi:MAG: response regulator [Burkholderiales bacterium]|nr:response regulator [Burkholderiales bacterium]